MKYLVVISLFLAVFFALFTATIYNTTRCEMPELIEGKYYNFAFDGHSRSGIYRGINKEKCWITMEMKSYKRSESSRMFFINSNKVSSIDFMPTSNTSKARKKRTPQEWQEFSKRLEKEIEQLSREQENQ